MIVQDYKQVSLMNEEITEWEARVLPHVIVRQMHVSLTQLSTFAFLVP
jgi:hypothetical protein